MERSPLHQQVDTLPALIREMIDDLVQSAREILPAEVCQALQRVFICGCGDSHHAALAAELALEQLAGLPCEAQTAMQLSRYGAAYMPHTGPRSSLLLGVSVSGQVSRTVEALNLGRQAGALTVALTGNPQAPLAKTAELLLQAKTPPLPDELKGMIVPGTRSYYASLLALYTLAIHLGQERGKLSRREANGLRGELAEIPNLMEETIATADAVARRAAEAWLDAGMFVYCGSGPNYGTALFSAAKLLEASGDAALGQDTEEWAHLQYFARAESTPTLLISGGMRDADRTVEVAEAAQAIGRRLAIIAPDSSPPARVAGAAYRFPFSAAIRECFTPLVSALPAALFAAYRAQLLGEPYFRAFGGGRSKAGGGGISRIRSSHQIQSPIS